MDRTNEFLNSLVQAEDALNDATIMGNAWAIRYALTHLMFAALWLEDIKYPDHHAGHDLLMELYGRVNALEL